MAASYLIGKSFEVEGKKITVNELVEGTKSYQCTDTEGKTYTYTSRVLGSIFPKPASKVGRTKRTAIQVLHDGIKAYGEGIADPTARAAALQDLTTYVISLNK